MPIMNWSEQYSVGVSELDNHHKKLINLLNDLHDAMKQGKSKELTAGIINELVSYAANHFAAEEKYMVKFNFPGYQKHKSEHESFVAKVVDFQNDYNAGKMLLTVEIMDFLKQWLINHIQKTDKEYGPFFNEKGLH